MRITSEKSLFGARSLLPFVWPILSGNGNTFLHESYINQKEKECRSPRSKATTQQSPSCYKYTPLLLITLSFLCEIRLSTFFFLLKGHFSWAVTQSSPLSGPLFFSLFYQSFLFFGSYPGIFCCRPSLHRNRPFSRVFTQLSLSLLIDKPIKLSK